jgi:hypothetical protein
MRRALLFVFLAAWVFPAACFGQDCSQFNQPVSDPAPDYTTDATGHGGIKSGDPSASAHWFQASGSGGCSYVGLPGSACTASCGATMSAQWGENGYLLNPLVYHQAGGDYGTGSGTGAAGGSVACQSTAAVSVLSCLIGSFCTVHISVSGGFGSVSFDPSSIWNHPHSYVAACPGHTAPSQGDPTCHTTNPGCPMFSYWNPGICACVYTQSNPSPILIDTDGSGFHLTSAENGVLFDFFATGTPIKISWTAANSTNGWLALDRNGDAKIDSAKELFGNLTDQPPSKDPNGFLALAVFDLPANGGNGDGVIDSQDAVWSKLRVWTDANHDGISQPEELRTLDELGIRAIDLKYHPSRYTDRFGNQFRYKGSLRTDRGASVDRQTYDVILVPAAPVPVPQTSASLNQKN